MHPSMTQSASLPPRKKYSPPTFLIRWIFIHAVSLQKEENGHIKTTVPSSQNQFVQSGLGPGQEYEIAINMVRNNTRGPQTTKTIITSKFQGLGTRDNSC